MHGIEKVITKKWWLFLKNGKRLILAHKYCILVNSLKITGLL